MLEIIETQEALKVGASVTLAELEETLRYYVKTKPGNRISHVYYNCMESYNYHNIIINFFL